jgi:DNA-binding NtrC family response regulator
MDWQMRIQEPSGEVRTIPLSLGQQEAAIGRDTHAVIALKDPTAPVEAAILWVPPEVGAGLHPGMGARARHRSPFWIRVPAPAAPVLLGDLPLREAELPAGVCFRIGETRLVLEPRGPENRLPTVPPGARPWLTCSPEGRQLLWTARKAADTPLSIYVAGETGTGKEVIAQLLHSWSPRAAGPFVPLHCGALAVSLAESELFGHVKGAFTGAIHQRPGALMQAHGGTLFLDEIGDLPLDIQVKLLRFLENGEIRPVGADRPSRAEVRLLCATHHPLLKLVEEGKFRRDLYYRLASLTLEIPPLRSRPEDVELLASRYSGELGRSLSAQALLRLQAHSWPGNVRELRHAVERACGLAGPFSPVLDEEHFEFLLTAENVTRAPELELGAPVLSLEEMERVLLLRALGLSRGNRARAAKILGVARSTLFEMLKRHRIEGPRTTQGCPQPAGSRDAA